MIKANYDITEKKKTFLESSLCFAWIYVSFGDYYIKAYENESQRQNNSELRQNAKILRVLLPTFFNLGHRARHRYHRFGKRFEGQRRCLELIQESRWHFVTKKMPKFNEESMEKKQIYPNV